MRNQVLIKTFSFFSLGAVGLTGAQGLTSAAADNRGPTPPVPFYHLGGGLMISSFVNRILFVALVVTGSAHAIWPFTKKAAVDDGTAWRDAKLQLENAMKNLKKPGLHVQEDGIDALVVSGESLRKFEPGVYNGLMMDAVDAFVTYAKANSGGWTRGFVGRRAPK